MSTTSAIHQYRIVLIHRKRNFQARALVLAHDELQATVLAKNSMEKHLCDYFKLNEVPERDYFWDEVEIQITVCTEVQVLNFGWDRLTHGSVKVGPI